MGGFDPTRFLVKFDIRVKSAFFKTVIFSLVRFYSFGLIDVIDAFLYEMASIAVLGFIDEKAFHPVRHSWFVEGAMLAVRREIGMVVAEDDTILPRIAFQSPLWFVCRFFRIRNIRRFLIGGYKIALAVPAVARPVFVPERMLYGEHGVPEYLVVRPRMNAGGLYPFEVREYVLFTQELLPVGCMMCTDNRRVIFRPEPWFYQVCCYKVLLSLVLFWFLS